jgi:hypothetical protein
LRLRYKVLLINSVAALVAAVVLSVAYANTRSVAQEYLMTLEEVVPKTRALDGLQSAIIAVIGSTHELALLRLAPRDLTVSFREIESGEMEDLQEAVANFWANLATYQLRSANDAREQAPATAILERGPRGDGSERWPAGAAARDRTRARACGGPSTSRGCGGPGCGTSSRGQGA